jgi:hypothetical protein
MQKCCPTLGVHYGIFCPVSNTQQLLPRMKDDFIEGKSEP